LAAARDDLGQVERHVPGREAELVEVMEQGEDLRRAQQGLGRYAAPVEADTAEMLALDDSGLHAQLRRADGCDIAAWAGADDDKIEAVICCGHGASRVLPPTELPARNPPT